MIAIGESRAKVVDAVGDDARHCVDASTMEEAVEYARALAEPGDVVLLSPACASFDMFENYEERGDVFKMLVRGL